MDREIDRDIENFCTLGVVHPEEKDVAPAAVSQVHAHRSAFAQYRIETRGWIALGQFLANPQRLICGVAHSEHPLIPAHTADAAADLVGQSLERQFLIS